MWSGPVPEQAAGRARRTCGAVEPCGGEGEVVQEVGGGVDVGHRGRRVAVLALILHAAPGRHEKQAPIGQSGQGSGREPSWLLMWCCTGIAEAFAAAQVASANAELCTMPALA